MLRRVARAARGLVVRTRLDSLLARSPLPQSPLRPDIDCYPAPSWRMARRDGVTLRLDLSDYMQWSAYHSVERDLRARLYDLARPGGVVIDVGSNIGEVLLGLSRRVGPPGRAIGFEANPETLKLCQANIALNPTLPAEVHGVGLGDADGTLFLHRPAATNSGADRLRSDIGGGVAVPVTTLDRFVEKNALRRVDLIKIDVEGFEMKVLAGAEAALARFRPLLFVELCDSNLREQGSTAADLIAWLEARGYAIEAAADGAPLTSISPLSNCFLDVIARPV